MKAAAKLVGAFLERLEVGRLTVVLPDGQERAFEGKEPGPEAELRVLDDSLPRRLLAGAGVALGEAYMDGAWDTPDLRSLLEFASANLKRHGPKPVPEPLMPLQRLMHRLRPNTRRGARRNIAAHYDLSNDFYSLWLDPSMAYSCADFEGTRDTPCTDADLTSAQERKNDRVLEMSDPRPGESVLEIGCGWGGFALQAARKAGVRITGITISDAQRDFASKRARRAGFGHEVEIRLQDYRDVEDRFDHVVSIEMFEAVGERYWRAFFDSVGRCLAPTGRAAMQVITISEERFAKYRRRTDFTQKHIFPGGMLPSVSTFRMAVERAGLTMSRPRFLAESYAKTLDMWLTRFDAAEEDVHALGFDERFVRMWRYYLASCRAGFKTGVIDVMQTTLTHSGR